MSAWALILFLTSELSKFLPKSPPYAPRRCLRYAFARCNLGGLIFIHSALRRGLRPDCALGHADPDRRGDLAAHSALARQAPGDSRVLALNRHRGSF